MLAQLSSPASLQAPSHTPSPKLPCCFPPPRRFAVLFPVGLPSLRLPPTRPPLPALRWRKPITSSSVLPLAVNVRLSGRRAHTVAASSSRSPGEGRHALCSGHVTQAQFPSVTRFKCLCLLRRPQRSGHRVGHRPYPQGPFL